MKAVIQRVKNASVTVEGQRISAIGQGLLVLLGVAEGDTERDAEVLAAKIANLRIFSDENDKMNLSLLTVGGEMLVVSQFTLCADCRKGRRPDYVMAAAPAEANRLYEYFSGLLKCELKHTAQGIFGADMELTIVNDGPVTIVMDSKVLLKK